MSREIFIEAIIFVRRKKVENVLRSFEFQDSDLRPIVCPSAGNFPPDNYAVSYAGLNRARPAPTDRSSSPCIFRAKRVHPERRVCSNPLPLSTIG